MATVIANTALVAAGKALLEYIQAADIPYVNNGMTLAGMDCQGLVEYLLIQAGVPKAECGLAGSNAHWRACVWRGTPEECKAKFGRIPEGAALFIHDDDGGEPDKYQGDGYGNASHIGLVWGSYESIAASASRGKVIESNFAGKSINGGWNRIGLLPWVDYGIDAEELVDSEVSADTDAASIDSAVDTTAFYPIKQGCLGGAVRRLQTWLTELDYVLTVDGEFGPKTDNAVKYFQKTHDLEADGYVGKATWAALAQARYDASVQG